MTELETEFTEEGEVFAHFTPESEPDVDFVQFRVTSHAFSAKLAAKLDIAPIFRGDINAQEKAFVLDAVLDSSYYEEDTISGVKVGIKKGLGVRVALRVRTHDVEMALNFGMIAANADSQSLSVDYSVVGIALPRAVVKDLVQVPLQGRLDITSFASLARTIKSGLPEHLRQLEDPDVGFYIVPPLTGLTDTPVERARSVYFAMTAITDELTLTEALRAADADFDHELIRLTYWKVLGGADWKEGTPERSHIRKANLWLSKGVWGETT